MDYDIVVSKFELQSCYYVHFHTNIFGKGMNPSSFAGMGLFANGPGDQVEAYQRLKKWYLILPCLTQRYKVRIKGKVEQSKERSCAFPYTQVL